MFKHDEKLDKRKIKLVSFISFLMGFFQALFIYVMSTYFKEASGTENIGPFYLFSYAIAFFIFLNLHKLVKNTGKAFIFHISIFAKIVSLALLLVLPPSFISIGALMLYIISGSIEWVALDAILESYSIDNMSGRIRGRFLTLVNAGYLIGPFLSTTILSYFGYSGIFFILLLANIFLFVLTLLAIQKVDHDFKENLSVRGLFRKISQRKNILRIYHISFILEFFYALIIIYTPIYLLDLGISWEKIGIIFTLMLLPFVLLQYPLGNLADRKIGEKKIILGAILIIAVFTLAIYFVSSTQIWIWALVLFGTRIGAAMIEIMRDSYFYKRIDSCNVDVINFFRTAQPSAYIISTALAFLIFRFFPGNAIRLIFLLVTLVLISGFFSAFRLSENPPQDNQCTK